MTTVLRPLSSGRQSPRPPSRSRSKTSTFSRTSPVKHNGTTSLSATNKLPKLSEKKDANAPSELDFNRILNLFKHKHTRELYTRQAAMLAKIVRLRKDGLYVSEMPAVREILVLSFEAAKLAPGIQEIFAPGLSSLILLHSVPIRVRPTFVFKLKPFQMFTELLDNLTIIARESLLLGSEQTALALSQLVTLFCTQTKTNIQGQMLSRLLCETEIPARLATWLIDRTDLLLNTELGLNVLKSLRDTSLIPACVPIIFKNDFFESISPLLLSLEPQSERLSICVDILWNLLYNPEAIKRFSTEYNFNLLSDLLHNLMSQGFRTADKHLRNDVLCICCLLSQSEHSRMHFARSPLLRLLLSFSAHMDEKVDPSSRSTAPTCDFEMKKLIWAVVSALPPEPFCTAQIVQANFLQSLFHYLELDPNQQHPSLAKWATSQLLELQMRAVTFVPLLAEHIQEQYVNLNGSDLLLNLALQCINGKSAHDPHSELYTLLQQQALDALLRVCSSLDIQGQEQSPEKFSQLIDLFSDPTNSEAVKTNVVCILSLYLEGNPVNQRLFRRASGIKQLVDFLKRDVAMPGVCKSQALRLSVLDCVWAALENNKKNQMVFLVQDGMDVILRVFSKCQVSQRKQILSFLSDLLQNPHAHEYFHEWNMEVPVHSDISDDLVHWGKQVEKIDKNGASTFTTLTSLNICLSLWEVEDQRLGPVLTHPNSDPKETPVLNELLKVDDSSSDEEDDPYLNNTSNSYSATNSRDLNGSQLSSSSNLAQTQGLPAIPARFSKHTVPRPPEWTRTREDLRPSIYACLSLLKYDSFPYATEAQSAQLRLISAYQSLRECESFRSVVNDFEEEELEVIPHDLAFLQEHINLGEEGASQARQLHEEFKHILLAEENEVLHGFIKQVEQRTDQKGITKRSGVKLNSTAHFLAKEDRDRMLFNSLDKHATLKRTTNHPEEEDESSNKVNMLDARLDEKLARDIAAQLGSSPSFYRTGGSKVARGAGAGNLNESLNSVVETRTEVNNATITDNNLDEVSDYITTQVLDDPVMDSLFGPASRALSRANKKQKESSSKKPKRPAY